MAFSKLINYSIVTREQRCLSLSRTLIIHQFTYLKHNDKYILSRSLNSRSVLSLVPLINSSYTCSPFPWSQYFSKLIIKTRFRILALALIPRQSPLHARLHKIASAITFAVQLCLNILTAENLTAQRDLTQWLSSGYAMRLAEGKNFVEQSCDPFTFLLVRWLDSFYRISWIKCFFLFLTATKLAL